MKVPLLLLKLVPIVFASSDNNGLTNHPNPKGTRTDSGQSELKLLGGSPLPLPATPFMENRRELPTDEGILSGNAPKSTQTTIKHAQDTVPSQKSPSLYAHRQKRNTEPLNHEEDMQMLPSEQRSAYIQPPQNYPPKTYAPQPYQKPPQYPTYPAYQPPKQTYQQYPPKYTQYQPSTYLAPPEYDISQKTYQGNQPSYPAQQSKPYYPQKQGPKYSPTGYGPAPQKASYNGPQQTYQPAAVYPQKEGQYPSKPSDYPVTSDGSYPNAYGKDGGENDRYDLMPYSYRTVHKKMHHKKYYYDDDYYDDDKYIKLTYKQLKKLLKLDSYSDNYNDYPSGYGYKSADDDEDMSEEAFREARTHKKKHHRKHKKHHHKKFRLIDDSEEDEGPNMARNYHLAKCHHDDDYYDGYDKYDDDDYGYVYRALANLEDADEERPSRIPNNSSPRAGALFNAGHEALNFAQKAGSNFGSAFDEDRKSLMGAARFLAEGVSQGIKPFFPKAKEAQNAPRNAYAGVVKKPYLGLLKDPYGYDDDDYDDYATIVHHKHKGHKKGHYSKPPAHDHHALVDMYGKCPVCDIHETYEKGKYMSEQALKKLDPNYSSSDIESTLYDLTHSDSSKAPSYSQSYDEAPGTKKKVLGPSDYVPQFGNPGSYSNQAAPQASYSSGYGTLPSGSYSNQAAPQASYSSGYGTPPAGYGVSQQGVKSGSAPGVSYGLYGTPAYGIKKTYTAAHDPVYSIVSPVQAPAVSYTSVY